jgi:hypothetical protein
MVKSMNTNVRCPLCNTEATGASKVRICDPCADVIEFGYPSFPAYSLKKEKALRVNGTSNRLRHHVFGDAKNVRAYLRGDTMEAFDHKWNELKVWMDRYLEIQDPNQNYGAELEIRRYYISNVALDSKWEIFHHTELYVQGSTLMETVENAISEVKHRIGSAGPGNNCGG